MAKSYRQTYDAEWVRMPLQMAKHIACCDCGLTHKFRFRVVNGKVYMAVWRDDTETAKVRRMKPAFPCRPTKKKK